MQVFMLKCKIHRATVTDANLNYIGSITVDEELMAAANLFENEKVTIVDIDNGERFETYVIMGEKGKGDICLNGAAARLVHKGDKVIIMAYCIVDENIAREFSPIVVHVNENNRIIK
jgi:aspartate 1-decarboxylase